MGLLTNMRTHTHICEAFSQAVGITLLNETGLRIACSKLIGQLECNALIVTKRKDGLSLFESPNDLTHYPSTSHIARDKTGAGDVVTATLSLSLACGENYRQAAQLANLAGGIKVQKLGTETVSKEEMIRQIGTR